MRAFSFDVLRSLASGSPCSGARLASASGVPPAAVRTAVRELRALGVDVRAIRGRGYALQDAPDLLDRAAIAADLAARGSPISLEVVDECPSTNAVLLARAASGARAGAALACELQSAGRGRRGAAWRSGLMTGLAFSVLWRYQPVRTDFAGLPLAVGVACVRALDALGIPEVALKWPNDLVHAGRKLGGILVEASAEPRGPTVAAVGVGINVRRSYLFAESVGQPVSDLTALAPHVPPRTVLLGGLLAEIGTTLDAFGTHGFAMFRDAWLRRHALQDERVRLLLPGGAAIDGVALGVAEDGALLLATATGVQQHHAGEVSLRSAA
ncbi:MAG: biotin--[acetyl-CoA-carboxylase] ligase [Burkholderiales bacterium]|nr:biotin--[acetyl-CoA-carboxylase] ligase [Burkholderiales bacterium]